ncbi:UNVERIFIED_CONTAM: protein NLP9 [Sesamum calycinum]|uniref:Protein NLP9 n=1 Tax=Sesamum calycinum TaxID=2727403 RepID=A0AAW2QMB5_9LAMI
MEGIAAGSTDNGVRCSNLKDPFCNVAELMNFDTYAGWCNSPSNLADQMFPSFALSPLTSAATNFSPFDGLNFMHQYNSGIPMVDGDIMGGSFVNGDKVMFHHMDSQLPCAANFADDGFDMDEMRDKSSSQHNLVGDVGDSVIPRPPVQSLAEKMLRALNLFKEWSGGGILAQVWVPMKNGDQYILSTCEQPYLLDQTLSGYREVSRLFTFAAESKPGFFPGLPGRVFASKIPEWTSNVMYYNKAEYLRVQHAVDHEVRGSIALPVFEDDSLERSCCAVLELVTMKEKSNFDLEMENVCRALQSLSKNQRTALAEITDVLRAVCHAHRLPLALTWIPCSHIKGLGDESIKLRAKGCSQSAHEKCVLCIESTACYVNDKDMKGFVHACAEHSLEEGQGIVGKALQSNHPFFYPDVKEYHISDYPLVHHARKFGLNAAVAIRLRNAELQGGESSKVKLQDVELRNIPAMVLSRRSSEQSLINGNLNSVDHATQNTPDSTSTGVEADGPNEQRITGSRKHMEKKRNTAEKHVSLSVLQQYFSGSLKMLQKVLG